MIPTAPLLSFEPWPTECHQLSTVKRAVAIIQSCEFRKNSAISPAYASKLLLALLLPGAMRRQFLLFEFGPHDTEPAHRQVPRKVVMKKPLWILVAMLCFSVSTCGQDLDGKLLEAAKARNTAEVQKLLGEGADANAKDNAGWTALIWAAYFGRTDTVRALLVKGADVNAKGDSGKTALMSAAVRGHTDTVRTLLEKGADVNAKSKAGRTALMSASDLGQLDTVRVLLEQGADVDAKDRKGDTALRLAEKYKYSTIVALLRRAPRVPPRKSAGNATASVPTAPPTAAGPTSAPKLQPALSASTASQDLHKKLLDAAEAGDTAEVQSLLRDGANANAKGDYGNTALMGAAVRGHTETARALLEKGADVNAKGNTGRTALMEAALEGYTDTVRTLLEKGADVNAQDNMGWTPLFWAAFSRRTDTVRALLEKGAEVNAKNKYDDTPLIHAAYAGDTDTVAVLLEKGADVNAKDDMGRTALIEAARQGRTETVRALLEVGADVTTRDKEGETALSKAEKHNYSDVIALLKNPAGILQSKKLRKPSTSTPDASLAVTPAVTPPSSSPVATGDEGLEKEPSAQSFYRIGLNMRLIEVLWSQTGELAARCAVGLEQDLKKVAAPGDLIELANRAAFQLKLRQRERDSSVPILIRELRVRLDKLCKAQTEGQFFCTAGAFTYDRTLFGEDGKDPGHAKGSVEEGRHKTLLLTSAL